ncbi:MAG TPA: R3H domain-containing nucleic acid-binding protein, partial [Dehalococcoidia bacterium]|nr:R3H domain-containing nucleic acid-binding protein [Dehalococcoidia bacterium]
TPQIRQFLKAIFPREKTGVVRTALDEAEDAVAQVTDGEKEIELSPQSSYIRRLQHVLAERQGLSSRSEGKEPQRRVKIYRGSRRA